MEYHEFWVNLRTTDLLGYQESVSGSAVAAIIRGIEMGDSIPPVIVVREGTKLKLPTVILPGTEGLDGGHHRSVAHLLADRPLKCRWLSGRDRVVYCVPPPQYRPIQAIALRDDDSPQEEGLTEYERRKRLFAGYR